jgi:hypothetical protein
MRQQQQRRQLSAASTNGSGQRRGSRATSSASIVSKKSDQIVYSNGVTKSTRPLTPRDIRRGFTGKVTQDGRALVKINGRVLAVPADRVGIKTNRNSRMGAPRASHWTASKRALVSADVKKIATASLKNKARTGGGKPPGGGGGGGDTPEGRNPIWSATKKLTPAQNAYEHWKKHGAEFPEYRNAKQYADAARRFVNQAPLGSLTKNRANGEVIIYHPPTNTFAIKTASGAPKTMFKPDLKKHVYKTNLEYFYAQK